MLYSQIVLTRGIPFSLQLPSARPTAIGDMNRTELDAELAKEFGIWMMPILSFTHQKP